MKSLDYKTKNVAQAEEKYRSVHLDQRQRELVNFLGKWFSQRIGMAELPCRGYWVLAVAEWQVHKNRTVRTLDIVTLEERLAAATEIAGYFRTLVARALVEPDQQEQLEEAIRDGMIEYRRLYL